MLVLYKASDEEDSGAFLFLTSTLKIRFVLQISMHQKAFTTLELIVIFAFIIILGVFALVIINPAELSRQRRDGERKKILTTVGEALISFSQSRNGVVPNENENWMSVLESRGDLKQIPKEVPYDITGALCKKNQKLGMCYDTDSKSPPNQAIVYTKVESVSENTKCNVSLGETAWYVYDLISVRSGIVCTVGTEPMFVAEGQRFKD